MCLAGFRGWKACSLCVNHHHYLQLQSQSPGARRNLPDPSGGWAAYLNSSSPTSLRQQS